MRTLGDAVPILDEDNNGTADFRGFLARPLSVVLGRQTSPPYNTV